MSFEMIINIFVAILLMVTIGYAVILNKRLGNLLKIKASTIIYC